MDRTPLRDFLEIPYDRLEEMNLAGQAAAPGPGAHGPGSGGAAAVPDGREAHQGGDRVLHRPRGPACTCSTTTRSSCSSAADNLTFDGSSIRGFSQQAESDLRLGVDWTAFYWLPADVFGPGKVLVFGVRRGAGRDALPRRHAQPAEGLHRRAVREGRHDRARVERDRGVPLQGARRRAPVPRSPTQFEFISTGGYYHSLPGDALRQFIDASAEAQRALGFANEKDHPEVAPSQFEMNYPYTEACVAADQVQLYKLICRQVAQQLDMTASLPAQAGHRRQRQRHAHEPLAHARRLNLFWDAAGKDQAVAARAGLHRPHPGQRQRHLPDPQLERQRLPPARPALRGAEPDQGVGDQPRRDGPHPARQREVRPHRGALDRARRQPVPGDLHAAADGPRGAAAGGLSRRASGSRTRFLPDNIYDAIRLFKRSTFAGGAARRGRAGEVRRGEAGAGRPLPQGARAR